MKNISRYLPHFWLMALAITASALVFISCEDNQVVKTELLSFGPSGVLHGDDITFFGTGLDKVSAIVFPVGVEVPKSGFKSQSSTTIVVTVPIETTEGKVILKTSAGDIETKTNFGLTYEMVIEGMPAEATPGTNATFTGQFLNYVKEVVFSDGLSVTDFVSQSRTELVVAVPLAAKTGPVQFSDGKLEPQVVEEVLTVALPEVTGVSPLNVKHAEPLTLTGTNLHLVVQVKFPSGATVGKANFTSQSPTEIVLAVPVTATNGKLKLTAISEVEVETATAISIVLPNVTAFSPSDPANHTAGTTLIMTGTDLDLVGAIKFPGVADNVTVFTKTATQIDVVIPSGVQGGTVILYTIHNFSVPVAVPFGDQLVLAKVIYDEGPVSPFGAGGGWGGVTTDAASTENPRVGSKSAKVTFANSWGGGCQFGTWGNSPLPTTGAAYFAFSIFGGLGTEGKEINVNVSGVQTIVVVKEGKWTDVKIALSSVGSPASLSEVWFQDRGWAGVVYIDFMGLK